MPVALGKEKGLKVTLVEDSRAKIYKGLQLQVILGKDRVKFYATEEPQSQ